VRTKRGWEDNIRKDVRETEGGGCGLTRMVEMRYAYNIFVRKPEGKRLYRKARQRLEDNIKMDRRCGLDSCGSE
jgi:hypothetical protein